MIGEIVSIKIKASSQEQKDVIKRGEVVAECWIPRTGGGSSVCRGTGYIVKCDDGTAAVIIPEQIIAILN